MVDYGGPSNTQVQLQYGYMMQAALQPVIEELSKLRQEVEKLKRNPKRKRKSGAENPTRSQKE
jgi:hypothetical protein